MAKLYLIYLPTNTLKYIAVNQEIKNKLQK
ncbi:hypothetical protein N824_04175 [Pedobacter sp. V48]|nr:hypothetical protein N824_04175 [Pedobacter sp. V48]